jgi:hypothetical protein
MSLLIHVHAYSGYKANERPREFVLDDDYYEIVDIEDRWYEPEAMYFRVRTTDDKRYVLRYRENADEWTLESGLDGDELLMRPRISLITVDAALIHRAEKLIIACEHCHPEDAEIPFDWVLDRVTASQKGVRSCLSGVAGQIRLIGFTASDCRRMRSIPLTSRMFREWATVRILPALKSLQVNRMSAGAACPAGVRVAGHRPFQAQ